MQNAKSKGNCFCKNTPPLLMGGWLLKPLEWPFI